VANLMVVLPACGAARVPLAQVLRAE
jgi:hypothetical protein